MENFILWNVSFNTKMQELSFFATAIQIKRINQGTKEMLQTMLQDIGLQDIDFQNWTIKHFLTNYLMDEPPSENWQDIWMDTWEIKIQLEKSIHINLESTELIRTYARDSTWKGESIVLPVECLLVAHFPSSHACLKAKSILEKVLLFKEDTSLIPEIDKEVSYIYKDLLVKIHQLYIEKGKSINQDLDKPYIYQREEFPKQLMISLGCVDEEFFVSGAKLAQEISNLIYQLDGTATWNETTDEAFFK